MLMHLVLTPTSELRELLEFQTTNSGSMEAEERNVNLIRIDDALIPCYKKSNMEISSRKNMIPKQQSVTKT